MGLHTVPFIMPTLPSNNKCSTLGCNNPRSKLHSCCIEHGGKDTNTFKASEARKEFNSMYNTTQWKKLRIAKLSTQPLCQACLCDGRIVAASQVDHLFSWTALSKEAFYYNIFQSLCDSCHSQKSALEYKDIYRHYKDGNVVDYSIRDYSYVLRQEA